MNQVDFDNLCRLDRANDYVVHGDPDTADGVLAFSFGHREEANGIWPGRSNDDTARYIETYLPNLPIIAQLEVAEAFQSRSVEHVIREHRMAGAYLDALEVALQAQRHMLEQGWILVIVVAHPALETRCNYLCAGLGIDTIAPAGLKAIRYDPDSTQVWTRNPHAWWGREAHNLISMQKENRLKKPRGA